MPPSQITGMSVRRRETFLEPPNSPKKPSVKRKRARVYSYRKVKNCVPVSVKRDSKELAGRERRIRINELLWFLPSKHLNTLTLKQLEVLLQSHRCSVCEKVFRLVSGVKIHMEDKHNASILFYFKKVKKSQNNNVTTNNRNLAALDQCTSERNGINPNALLKKQISPISPSESSRNMYSVGNYLNFKCTKPPRHLAKPLPMTSKIYRKRLPTGEGNGQVKIDKDKHNTSIKKTNKFQNNSAAMFTKNLAAFNHSTSDRNAKNPSTLLKKIEISPNSPFGYYRKMTPKTYRNPLLMTPKTHRKPMLMTPKIPRKPLLMTPRTYRKRFPADEGNGHVNSGQIGQVARGQIVLSKPKLMTKRKWNDKLTQINNNAGEHGVCATPGLLLSSKPKLMSMKKWKKKLAVTQKNDEKFQFGDKSFSAQVLQSSSKPKLMSMKKWKKKLALTQNSNEKPQLGNKSLSSSQKETKLPLINQVKCFNVISETQDVDEGDSYEKTDPDVTRQIEIPQAFDKVSFSNLISESLKDPGKGNSDVENDPDVKDFFDFMKSQSLKN